MSELILARIEMIQKELDELKKIVINQKIGVKRKANLGGIWQGIDVSDDEIKEAQRSIFKNINCFKKSI